MGFRLHFIILGMAILDYHLGNSSFIKRKCYCDPERCKKGFFKNLFFCQEIETYCLPSQCPKSTTTTAPKTQEKIYDQTSNESLTKATNNHNNTVGLQLVETPSIKTNHSMAKFEKSNLSNEIYTNLLKPPKMPTFTFEPNEEFTQLEPPPIFQKPIISKSKNVFNHF